jgi:hypothetical protein
MTTTQLPQLSVTQKLDQAWEALCGHIGARLSKSDRNAETFRIFLVDRGYQPHLATYTVGQLAGILKQCVDQNIYTLGAFEWEGPFPAAYAERLRAEAQSKMEAKQLKTAQAEAEQNSEAAFFKRTKEAQAKVDAKANQAAHDKAEEQAEKELDTAIETFQVYRNGRIDYGRTDSLKADLRRIEVRINNKRSAQQTLSAVRHAISHIENYGS